MSRLLFWSVVVGLSLSTFVAGGEAKKDAARPNSLSPQEIADGWILLFDGETTFGWRIDGDAVVKDGWLRIGGDKPAKVTHSLRFRDFEFSAEYTGVNPVDDALGIFSRQLPAKVASGKIGTFTLRNIADRQRSGRYGVPGELLGSATFSSTRDDGDALPPIPFEVTVPAKAMVAVRSIKLRPLETRPLLNGKDLTGWHENPTRKASKWTVEDKILRLRNGPGDLQTDGKWADFVLQAEIKTHGKALNSGIFFRCIPGDYQNGYEAQIQNGYKDNDRTKPTDFGTGAIYRRVPARKVVANDDEWFTMTVAAQGNRLATWVNGYMTVDWTDDRPSADNPRNGSKTGPGAISLQGHDPTTDISFRNLRIGDLPSPPK